MEVLTRRNAVLASGSALAIPLAGRLIEGQSATSTSQRQNAAGAANRPTVINADLQAYAVSEFPRLTARARQGTLAPGDYKSVSDSLHLLARHISTVDTEKLRTAIVQSLDTSAPLDLSGNEGVARYYTELKQHDPELSQSEYLQSFILSPSEVSVAKQSLAAHPISWHYHTAADALGVMSKNADGNLAPASFNPKWNSYLLSDGVYRPGVSVHLEKAAFCGLSAKKWCQLAAVVLAVGITIASLAVAWETTAAYAAAAWIAGQLGWTIAQVVAAARIMATIIAAIGSLCGIFLS